MSGNLTAVREMSGILLKVRKMSRKKSCQKKLPKTVYCKLHICVHTGIKKINHAINVVKEFNSMTGLSVIYFVGQLIVISLITS